MLVARHTVRRAATRATTRRSTWSATTWHRSISTRCRTSAGRPAAASPWPPTASSTSRTSCPWVIGFVLLLTLLMMGFTFRSVSIAIITTVLNLASVAAAFGVLTLVFQNSWAEGLLDFQSQGFVIDWIPLFMFVVLVGLSMDYHVFVLSRVREGIQRGLPPQARRRGRGHRDGRCGDQCGCGDGVGVRGVRDAEHDRDEADGRRPRGRGADRRDPDPGGHAAVAAGGDGPLRVVAGSAASARRCVKVEEPRARSRTASSSRS